MRLFTIIVSLSSFFFFLIGCDFIELDNEPDESVFVWTPTPVSEEEYGKAIEAIQRRSHHISEVEWEALAEIPTNSGLISKGDKYRGIPYSSVKELDKFVGQDVSFYTFLTAVQNPKSVLYTENVGAPPYNGVNCASYYGTVCSMAVNYVLGLDAPFESSMYEDLPFIERAEQQDPYGARIGDILWQQGHVVLIENINYNTDGEIISISIIESRGANAQIHEYSLAAFKKRWDEASWVLLRYLDFGHILKQDQIGFLSSDYDNYSVTYNETICSNRGDRACYRQNEHVVINILSSPTSGCFEITKDGVFFDKIDCYNTDADLVFDNLPPGKYIVSFLQGEKTSKTEFEIIQTEVNVEKRRNGINVFFSSENGIPETIVICSLTGARKKIIPISSSDIMKGSVYLKNKYDGLFLKVFFRGEYGRVTNNPICL